MAERPMFDDESLPQWLIEGGITCAGQSGGGSGALLGDVPPPWAQAQVLPPLPAFSPPEEDIPPPWASSAPPPELPFFAADAEPVPPISQTDQPFAALSAPQSVESSAHDESPMPWGAESGGFESLSADDPFGDLDWMQETPADQPAKPTFQTSWLSESMLPQMEQGDQFATPAFQTDWLTEADSAAATPAATDDWLSDFGWDSSDPFAAFDSTAQSAPAHIKPPDAPQPPASEDWLSALGTSEAESQPAAADLPDWMAEPESVSPPAAESAFEAPLDQGDLPDWLQAGYAEGQESAPAAADLPDWMAEPESVSPPAAESAFEAPLDQGDVPDWLRTGYLEAQESTPAQASAPADGDMAWIDQFDFGAPAAPPPADVPKPSRPVTPSAERDVLTDLDLDAILADAPDLNLPNLSVAPVDLDEEFDFEALPDLPPAPPPVSEAPPAPLPAAPPAPVPPSKATAEVSAVADLPEWVAEMRPDSKPSLRIGDQEIELEERPLSALPEPMLKLRERLKGLTAPPAAPENPDSPLSGIPEVLQPLSYSAAPPPLPPSGALATAAQLAGVQTLRQIVAAQEAILKRRESEDIGAPAHPKPRARLKLDRLLLTIFLAAILILPFFTDLTDLAPLPRFAQLDSAAQARLSAIGEAVLAIPRGASVLVALEYAPAAAAELDDLARVLLRDLIRREIKPILVSTNPAAALHGYNLLYRLSRDSAERATLGRTAPLLPRRDYIALGYLPGGASGVRTLANALYDDSLQRQALFETDLEGAPSGITAQQLAVLRANPIFLVAQRQEDVQTWVEQFRPPPDAPPQAPLRLVLASSAAAAPAAQAYAAAEPQRVIGTLSGLRDALLYRELRAQYTSPEAERQAERRWQSVGLSAFAAALAILIGAALNMIQFLVRRRRAR